MKTLTLLLISFTVYSTCSGQKILLTFDDGPDAQMHSDFNGHSFSPEKTITGSIAEVLNRYSVPSVFFINTERIRSDNHERLVRFLFDSDHFVASHGHTHIPHADRIINGVAQQRHTPSESRADLRASMRKLNSYNQFGSQNFRLMRFPYGRGWAPIIDDDALARIYEQDLIHLAWNAVSGDDSSTIPTSRSLYEDVCQSRHEVVVLLMHDYNRRYYKNILAPFIEEVIANDGDFISAEELIYCHSDNTNDRLLLFESNLPNRPWNYSCQRRYERSQDEDNEQRQDLIGNMIGSLGIRDTQNQCESNSSTRRFWNHCEGHDSVCINGEWKNSRRDASLIRRECPNR